MKIDHVHFYVEDAVAWRDWFIQTMKFQPGGGWVSAHTASEVVKSGAITFVLSSPLSSESQVAHFLRSHPPGIADLAFRVSDLEAAMKTATQAGAKVLQPVQSQRQPQRDRKWGQIAAWGNLRHTLLECSEDTDSSGIPPPSEATPLFEDIDHIVLNVSAHDFEPAIQWYEKVLGFEAGQMFTIQTSQSGLYSRVMTHPVNEVQLPINAPTSENSQIQEFLELNQGAGIQHLALRTSNIVQAIAHLQQAGLAFLSVPEHYYSALQERLNFALSKPELQSLTAHQVLIDWQDDYPDALLLQTFTQPLFTQPTFFFELIERRIGYYQGQPQQATGFGEGNFYALFAAIEQEQQQRGSL
jgi:4-hydroxyphenylpyruvate dioxygenase